MKPLFVSLLSDEATDAARFGPKAANLAALCQAGLPTPGGFCLDAEAYRLQLDENNLSVKPNDSIVNEVRAARLHAIGMRLGFLEQPIAKPILKSLLEVWQLSKQTTDTVVVRSSALVEDKAGSNFAGQFESFLDLKNQTDYQTAVRSCWAALWSTRVLRYMATHDLNAADTAMALLIQPLVKANVSGGGLSQNANGEMVISATWGLGSAIAQGEIVPDRYVLSRDGAILETDTGRKNHQVDCVHGMQSVKTDLVNTPCLNSTQLKELGELLLKAEDIFGDHVEIEWALDSEGIKLLQARPLCVETAHVPDEIWLQHPRLNGHPAGIGWGTGRARVVTCECQLSQVVPGDIMVTSMASPAHSHVLSRVSGVVTELGGSTSHFASLARERGIPMVLGVMNATTDIPDGSTVAVDGVAGVVRWMR
tara:strand:- start:2189 stop:3457 length:1269 start_codon:yes stop_codon:yes gene_type:complete